MHKTTPNVRTGSLGEASLAFAPKSVHWAMENDYKNADSENGGNGERKGSRERGKGHEWTLTRYSNSISDHWICTTAQTAHMKWEASANEFASTRICCSSSTQLVLENLLGLLPGIALPEDSCQHAPNVERYERMNANCNQTLSFMRPSLSLRGG